MQLDHQCSNPGYALLGALVEKLRGEPWEEVLQREVLEPLGMTRITPLPQTPHASGFAVHPWAGVMQPEPLTDTGAIAPAGRLWSTAADLCRWAAFLAGGAGEKVPAEIRRPAAASDGDGSAGYGLGLQLQPWTAGCGSATAARCPASSPRSCQRAGRCGGRHARQHHGRPQPRPGGPRDLT
ncbi:serine hydrolase domain-containing protein [Kitasatospora sp. NPDC001159]